jgi:hypothetical protein
MSLTTPRMGRAVQRLTVEHYGAFFAGRYQAMRDANLIRARGEDDPTLRAMLVSAAKFAHRDMFRCLREVRREERA